MYLSECVVPEDVNISLWVVCQPMVVSRWGRSIGDSMEQEQVEEEAVVFDVTYSSCGRKSRP